MNWLEMHCDMTVNIKLKTSESFLGFYMLCRIFIRELFRFYVKITRYDCYYVDNLIIEMKKDSSIATNFEQIFTTYSPDTVRKVL